MSRQDLTEGPVWRALASTSAPMTLGILSVLSVGLADAYFLGRLGQEPLAAVGFVYPTTTAIVSLSIGLSAGANAAISQAIGARTDGRDVSRMSLHALGLGVLLSLAVAGLLYGFYAPLFALMGAGPGVQEEIAAYVPLWSASFPFLVGLMVTNSIFRAHGNAVAASCFMISGAVINLLLTPLLVFGWGPVVGLGTEGAAMATLIGRVVAMIAGIGWAIRFGYLDKCGALWRRIWPNTRAIIGVGAPAAFSNAINPAGMAMVVAAVATLGDAAVAGFGAATRIQAVVIVVLMALSAGISPVVGQCWGAGRFDRARSALLQAWAFCLIYGAGLGLVLSFTADDLALWVAADEQAAGYAADYLRIVGWSLFGYGILVTANAAMNARSKAVYSMTLGLARTFLVYLPLAWLGVWTAGYGGILAAAVAANLFGVAGAVWFARRADLLTPQQHLRARLTA